MTDRITIIDDPVDGPATPAPPKRFDLEAHEAARQESEALGPDGEGRYLDPVSGRRMPRGSRLFPNPNREMRRRLERWRAKGA